MKKFLAALAFLVLPFTANAQSSTCAGEASLSQRTDALVCEGWTSSTWYQAPGMHDNPQLVNPGPVTSTDNTSVVPTNCFMGGPCLDVLVNSCQNGGFSGALSMTRDIPGNPDEVWLRYYMKIDDTFLADNSPSDGSANGKNCAIILDHGGKFTGLTDSTADNPPVGQCGNGGSVEGGTTGQVDGRGYNCWSARTKFDNCRNRGGGITVVCYSGSTTDTIRFGYYWYLPPNVGNNGVKNGNGDQTLQEFAPWDQYPGDDVLTCATGLGGNGTTASCGKGTGGLIPGQWHMIELHIKMNTCSASSDCTSSSGTYATNGVAEGWIDGVLRYGKYDVVFRLPGGRGLHIRQIWYQVVCGGDICGSANTSHVYLARLAACGAKRCGAYRPNGTYKSNNFNVRVQ